MGYQSNSVVLYGPSENMHRCIKKSLVAYDNRAHVCDVMVGNPSVHSIESETDGLQQQRQRQ